MSARPRLSLASGAACIFLAVLQLSPAVGQAQPAAQTEDKATVVAPLVITAPPADFPVYTPQQLTEVETRAHQRAVDAEACQTRNELASAFLWRPSDKPPPTPRMTIYARAQHAVEAAAAEARQATEAMLAAGEHAEEGPAPAAAFDAAVQAREAAVQRLLAAQAEVDRLVAARNAGDERARYGADYVRATRWTKGTGDSSSQDARRLADGWAAERRRNSIGQGVYIPEDFKDLAVSNIVAALVTTRKGPVLRITGYVNNTRDHAIRTPPLWAIARDEYGVILNDRQYWPPLLRFIPSHGRLAFNLDFTPPPDHVAAVSVTFAGREALAATGNDCRER